MVNGLVVLLERIGRQRRQVLAATVEAIRKVLRIVLLPRRIVAASRRKTFAAVSALLPNRCLCFLISNVFSVKTFSFVPFMLQAFIPQEKFIEQQQQQRKKRKKNQASRHAYISFGL